jgi:hypothetical protein
VEIEVFPGRAEEPLPPPRTGRVPSAAPRIAVGVPRPTERRTDERSGAATGGRAAELVERLRRLAIHEPEPGHAMPATELRQAASTPAAAEKPARAQTATVQPQTSESADAPASRELADLCGVRWTGRGVRFVQPSAGEAEIFVAGDFNNWSPTTTRLLHNPQLGIAEVLVEMSPGRHAYRLVVDGRWQADPYNDRREPNEHGEYNSIVVVPAREVMR